MIAFDDVYKRFGDKQVLAGVSLRIDAGKVHFIIGESGAGKSVLIKQVVGLIKPDRGAVRFCGADVVPMGEAELLGVRRRCQMIFQHATLFDALSVLENIAMPLRKRFGLGRRQAQAKAREALALVHVLHTAERLPSELGAGVQKRVAIARALALEPEVLLYDEPTTSLDPIAARRTDRLIAETTFRLGLTSVVVSHDMTSVRAIADRVAMLHEGRICFDGTATELGSSDLEAVRRFRGDVAPGG